MSKLFQSPNLYYGHNILGFIFGYQFCVSFNSPLNGTALHLPNSALIVQLITLLILSVPTIETENMMRSRSNKFWRHYRSYIRTRHSLIEMPSYELPLVRGWDNSISHLGSTASIGTSRCILLYRLSIEELWCRSGSINSASLNNFSYEKYLSPNLWNAWLHDKKFL